MKGTDSTENYTHWKWVTLWCDLCSIRLGESSYLLFNKILKPVSYAIFSVKRTEYCTLRKWWTETRESNYIIFQKRECSIVCDWGSETRESCYIRCEGSRVFMRLGPNLSPGLERGVEDSQLGGYILYLHTFSTCFIVYVSTESCMKKVWHKIFDFRLFSRISFPQEPEYRNRAIYNFYEICRDIGNFVFIIPDLHFASSLQSQSLFSFLFVIVFSLFIIVENRALIFLYNGCPCN